MNPILLDTHAAVWAADGRLKGEAVALVESAAENNELLLSPITAWEIGLLVRKKRLTLASNVEDYVRVLFGQPGVVLAALTPLIAAAAAYGARLVTRDKEIRATSVVRCANAGAGWAGTPVLP